MPETFGTSPIEHRVTGLDANTRDTTSLRSPRAQNTLAATSSSLPESAHRNSLGGLFSGSPLNGTRLETAHPTITSDHVSLGILLNIFEIAMLIT